MATAPADPAGEPLKPLNTPVDYVAELRHVRDVSLAGTADLAFWKDLLRKEELTPAERDGRAQVLIVAADAKFHGIRFRELSFTVRVDSPEPSRPDAGYLVRAFNSRRFFAFCERTFFSTPYSRGGVLVSASSPASIQLVRNGVAVFRAGMRADAAATARHSAHATEDGWDGPLFLPGARGQKRHLGGRFFARISGHTLRYPFDHSGDSVTIHPSQDDEVLCALVESHFVPDEWAIREDATHAKSKTYQRTEVVAARAQEAV